MAREELLFSIQIQVLAHFLIFCFYALKCLELVLSSFVIFFVLTKFLLNCVCCHDDLFDHFSIQIPYLSICQAPPQVLAFVVNPRQHNELKREKL